jgi:RNA polymerase sigma factor (sigma-70 family)
MDFDRARKNLYLDEPGVISFATGRPRTGGKGANVLQPVEHWSESRYEASPEARKCRCGGADTLTFVGEPLVELVASAKNGDHRAWEALVERLAGVVWRATADTGLSHEDRQDVFAAAFFRLFEHLADIREPLKLPGWLATTARNEVRQLLRAKRRLEPRDELEPPEAIQMAGVEENLLDGELRAALWAAFRRLGQPCQELLRLTSAVPPLSYTEISELTGIARGSLGPSRQRCLERLRRAPELRPFLEGAPHDTA